jgi:hypothetical protein
VAKLAPHIGILTPKLYWIADIEAGHGLEFGVAAL